MQVQLKYDNILNSKKYILEDFGTQKSVIENFLNYILFQKKIISFQIHDIVTFFKLMTSKMRTSLPLLFGVLIDRDRKTTTSN